MLAGLGDTQGKIPGLHALLVYRSSLKSTLLQMIRS